MIAAFGVFGLLVLLTPAAVLVHGGLIHGLFAFLTALALMFVTARLSSGEFRRFSRLVNLVGCSVLLLPLAWIFLQIFPLANRSLINPIWISSAAAMGSPAIGAISVDIGTTLIALTHYTLILGIALLAAAIALNRSFAAIVLSLLTIASTAVAAEMIIWQFAGFQYPALAGVSERADAATIAMIGLVLSAGTAVHVYQRLNSRKRGTTRKPWIRIGGLASIAAFCICLVAILTCADAAIVLAALLGVGAVTGVFAIRHWRLRSWGQAGVVAVGAVALAGLIATMPAQPDNGLTRRMLSDSKLIGTGAGTFEALVPIYEDRIATGAIEAPPAATRIAIEMGRPFLWFVVVSAIGAAVVLLRRSLRRGRDYVYSAAGAGCVVAALISLFASGGILPLTASFIVGATLGLGIAQSTSESETKSRDADQPAAQIRRTLWPRAAIALLALVLACQAAWLMLPELSYSRHIARPLNQKSITVARIEQERINQAASLAAVRGDLWAESALTYSGQLWTDQAMELDPKDRQSAEALNSLSQSLRYSPHRGDIWLMFAAATARYGWSGYQTGPLLKMSYYTAPNQNDLMPLRLSISLRSNEVMDDEEIRDMVRGDIDYILTRSPSLKPALAAAYRSASKQGKAIVEQVIARIEPTYLEVVRARYP